MHSGLPKQELPEGGPLGLRFNPAPGWPPPPPGFVPPPHWQPDPSWPPAPPGWQLWVDDDDPDPRRPGEFGGGSADAPPWAGGDMLPWAGGDAPPGADDRTGPQSLPPSGAAPPGAPTEVYGPGGGPGAAGTISGLAVASLVLGLIGFTVIGAIASVVCGSLAFGQIARTGRRGRGLAVTGLVLSALWLVALGAFLVLRGSSSPTQPSSSAGNSASATPRAGSSASPGGLSTNVFALRPGQCFQNPPASQTVLGVTYVTVVPCTTPHNAQAFVQFNAAGTSYPGVEALKRRADTGCHARIKKNVQTSKIKATMTLHYLYPLQASWNSGHRTITCMIVNARSNLTTSLLRSHPAGH